MSEDNSFQADYWNSDAGQKWLAYEAALDASMASILDRLLGLADLKPGERVLDLGCGTGASTIAAARMVGATGHVTGLDIAAQLLQRARSRNAGNPHDNTDFIMADAQSHELAPPSYDAIISRFGVMFFADATAAFTNMASALRPGGRIHFAAWGPISGNPWFAIPRDAAKAYLGTPSEADPFAPGPLAFQDAERVSGMMRAAGLAQVGVRTEVVLMRPTGSVADVARIACRVGPAARIIAEFSGSGSDTSAIESAIAAAFAKYATDDGLAVPATIHFFTAARQG